MDLVLLIQEGKRQGKQKDWWYFQKADFYRFYYTLMQMCRLDNDLTFSIWSRIPTALITHLELVKLFNHQQFILFGRTMYCIHCILRLRLLKCRWMKDKPKASTYTYILNDLHATQHWAAHIHKGYTTILYLLASKAAGNQITKAMYCLSKNAES